MTAAIFIFILLMAFFFQSCIGFEKIHGSGKVVKEERQVSGITGVALATLGKLRIELGDKEKLIIEAQENLLQYFETNVNNGILKIKTRNFINIRPTKPVKYFLTVKELDTIVLSSSGDIRAPDLKANKFSVTSSSSGDLEMGDLDVDVLKVRLSSSGDVSIKELTAKMLDVVISSSGDLHISGGEVEEQEIIISSSGKYKAKNLESARANVRISSSGDATIRVRDYLNSTLSSSGSVYYIGNPSVDTKSSSSGKVKKL